MIEYALGLLPTQQKRVTTATQAPYIGEQVKVCSPAWVVCSITLVYAFFCPLSLESPRHCLHCFRHQ